MTSTALSWLDTSSSVPPMITLFVLIIAADAVVPVLWRIVK